MISHSTSHEEGVREEQPIDHVALSQHVTTGSNTRGAALSVGLRHPRCEILGD